MINQLQRLKNAKAKKVDGDQVRYSILSESLGFPLTVKPAMPGLILNDWIKNNRNAFEEKVNKYGGVLLRGFNINTVEKFEEFTRLYVDTPLEYNMRSSPRYSVGNNVYHTTTYPAEYSINMHSESSYAPEHPTNIVFCCITPAATKGETPICDNRLVLANMSTTIRTKFESKGVMYVRNLTKELGLPWQEVFQSNSKSEVEETCQHNGMNFEWKGEDLKLTWTKKAIWQHPLTNESVWFNHAFFFNKYALEPEVLSTIAEDEQLPNNTYFGDGSEISQEIIEELREAYNKSMVMFPWEKGDVLFLDNMLISHGRNSYTGDRKIITSLFNLY
jgi:hypothetical protein